MYPANDALALVLVEFGPAGIGLRVPRLSIPVFVDTGRREARLPEGKMKK